MSQTDPQKDGDSRPSPAEVAARSVVDLADYAIARADRAEAALAELRRRTMTRAEADEVMAEDWAQWRVRLGRLSLAASRGIAALPAERRLPAEVEAVLRAEIDRFIAELAAATAAGSAGPQPA